MDSQVVTIEKPIYGGAFLGRLEGKAVFVPLALPGEQARVRIVESKAGYATAEVEEIVVAAPQRIAAACPHFGACGGCSYQHTDYATQLGMKQAILRETLTRGGVAVPESIDLLVGEPWGYRNRIRLAFDAAGRMGYRGRRSHAIVPLTACPIAAPLLMRAALAFADVAATVAPGWRPAELALFCNGDETELLAQVFAAEARNFSELAAALVAAIPELRGMELVTAAAPDEKAAVLARWGAESLTYRAAGAEYRVDQGAFFQVNRWLVDGLLERVAGGRRGRLAWDLFAGVGLFARRLAAGFERVIAVESAPAAMAALAANLGSRGEAVRAEALGFLRGRRAKERPELVVLDPPRTGLGAQGAEMLAAANAPELVYVSCDPATLARDLRVLVASGYAIERVTLADLFPQTFHLETVVDLRRA